MAKKEVAVGKRLNIDKSKRTMLGSVAVASLILGVCLVFSVYFLRYIKFNSNVLSEKGKAVRGYSNAIRDIGICKRPTGDIYTNDELDHCDPDDVDLSFLEGTLRYNVIVNLAQNDDLKSVARKGLQLCNNPATNLPKTTEELIEEYRMKTKDDERAAALQRISLCSALRVIPDALPSVANSLAVGANLNRLFEISGYAPESVTPGDVGESSITGVGSIGINLEIEDSAEVTMKALNNIEKSIREFNIKTARIEQQQNGKLSLQANAEAYFTEKAALTEKIVEVKGNGKILRNKGTTEK